jgi:hypothetical protein
MGDADKCTRVTRTGTQCRRRPIRGSAFCWQHQPIEVWVPTIVGIVLCLVFSLVFFMLGEASGARHANLERPRAVPLLGEFPILVADGSNTTMISKPGRYASPWSWSPFSYRIEPDCRIRMYGEIRDRSGCVVVQADGDTTRVVQRNGYDVNSDLKAIEVVDEEQEPVFQLSVMPYEVFQAQLTQARQKGAGKSIVNSSETSRAPLGAQGEQMAAKPAEDKGSPAKQPKEVMQLSYVVTDKGSLSIVTPRGTTSSRDLDTKDVEQSRQSVHRIFYYPAHKYPGKRAEATREIGE